MIPSSKLLIAIADYVNSTLAANEKYEDLCFVFLEEDNSVDGMLGGKFLYRLEERKIRSHSRPVERRNES
jgi:hypothetical protein